MSQRDAAAIVAEVRDAIQEAWEHDKDNRQEAATDLAFLSNNQWPDSVRRERERDGRPMLTINRLPQFVRQVTNDIRRSDISIKVIPEEDGDKELAKIFDGLIRQIQYKSNAKHVFCAAAEHQASCGIGWFRVTTDYADELAFDQEIRIERIRNPLSVFCDPAAILPDRSDARWIAVTELIPRKAFKAKYPKASESNIDLPRDTNDRPFFWSTTEGVRVAEFWRKVPVQKTIAQLPDGQVIDITDMDAGIRNMLLPPDVRTRKVQSHKIEQYIVSGSDVLEGPHEWAGRFIPLIPVIGGEFPLEDRTYRYSVIRYARDPQQLYNFARTSMAESMALAPKAPYLVTPAMIAPFKGIWDQANKRNLPYLPYEPDPKSSTLKPFRESPPDVPMAMIQEAQIAAEEMKGTTGIFDAGLGAKSNETSGVAITRRQQESDVANYHFVDNLEYSITHCGRVLVDLIPRIYDNERVIRLIGEQPGQEENVTINQALPVPDENGEPIIVNDLSAASYDVRVTLGRSFATRRQEAAETLAQFMQSMPPQQVALVMDLLAKNLDIPEADEMQRRLRKTVPPDIALDPNNPSDQEELQQAQSQQPPPPPEVVAAEAKLQFEQQKAQIEMAKAESQMAIEQQRAAIDLERERTKLEIERQKGQMDLAIKREQLDIERQRAAVKHEAEEAKRDDDTAEDG